MGGVGVLKDGGYDESSEIFVFPGISCGDAAFLYQCVI
jgi:hypothetical protein